MTQQQQAATARPWEVQIVTDGYAFVAAGAERICSLSEIANADLVVRAVNAHDGLVAACRDALSTLEALILESEDDDLVNTLESPLASVQQLRAALALAEGAPHAYSAE